MESYPAARYASAAEMHTALAGDLVGRVWHRVPPDTGHDRCWREVGSGTTHGVCVISRPDGRFDIDTRRASGAGTRVLDHCHEGINKTKLASTLRGVFERL